jgi:hypothetical protein
MTIKNLLCAGLTFFCFCLLSQSFTATYSFVNVSTSSGIIDPDPVPSVTGLTFGSFIAVGASANPNASGRFSFTNWPAGGINGDDNYANFSGVLSPTIYFEVTVSVTSGYTLDLNSISFAVRRSGTGIRNYCVRSNHDNYSGNLAASTGTNAKLSVIPTGVFFWNYDSLGTSSDQKGSLITLDNQFSSITNSVTFHFYAWNSESSGGTFSIDNVAFTGSVSAAGSGPVGLANLDHVDEKLYLFPNPSPNGIFWVKASEKINWIEVFGPAGEYYCSNYVLSGDGKIGLDLSSFANGMYFMNIQTHNSYYQRKIAISK